ncbi:MAG TPA: hypothetical protein VKU19_29045 [Bryobacteraceae bacterium]|nr:hypothetical protein [Bryobacteraceae bacterium]
MSQNRVRLLAGVVPLGIFFAFAGDGIRGYFAPDEMMNLYAAWFPPIWKLIQNDRPIGALAYRALFAGFGLNPLPYRFLCFVLLLANLALLYEFCRLVSGSREIAILACVIGAYHAHLADLYYISSIIFDLLCFFFYYCAFVYYLLVRNRSRGAGAADVGVLAVLYLGALGSKEMAVTLPVLMLVYEMIYYRGKLSMAAIGREIRHHAWFPVLSIPITIAYLAFKTAGAHRMTLNPDYLPQPSARIFLAGWQHYLFDLFYHAVKFSNFTVIAVWVGMLALAIAARNRDLLFAWCLALIGALPFIFINPRGFFVMYLTLPGWYLYASRALVLLRDGALRGFRNRPVVCGVRLEQLVLFALVTAAVIPAHRHEKPLGNAWVPAAIQQTRPVIERLAVVNPKLPHAAKVLFLSDPCPVDDYLLYFIVALHFRDKDVQVDRVKVNAALAAERSKYDYVFSVD